MPFRFRQFTIEDEKSTLRVSTDAMLLGSWADPGDAQHILDIGTGCGVLALMMAQKSGGMVDAIDIDPGSVQEAASNFKKSPWPTLLSVKQIPLQEFAYQKGPKYDFIISNPPYFTGSLKSPFVRKNVARHDDRLSFNDLVNAVVLLLKEEGRFALILPVEAWIRLETMCNEHGLYLHKKMLVHPKPGARPGRILAEYRKYPSGNLVAEELSILDSSEKFTIEYLNLTGGFHNF